MLRNLPGEGAFFRALFAAEPDLGKVEKKKNRRPATADEIAAMFGMKKPTKAVTSAS